MKKENKLYFVILCLFSLSGCGWVEYPPIDQLQITDKRFMEACNVVVKSAARINKEKQYDKNDLINSFVIRIGIVKNDTSFQFVYGNNLSIGKAVYSEFKTYGYFYCKNYIFLVQYHDIDKMIPYLFIKTGKQSKISFVGHYHKSFFTDLFKDKSEIVVMDNYSPIQHSFRYVNGKFIMVGSIE